VGYFGVRESEVYTYPRIYGSGSKYLTRNPWQSVDCKGGGEGNKKMIGKHRFWASCARGLRHSHGASIFFVHFVLLCK
jgi:hypothetical protein